MTPLVPFALGWLFGRSQGGFHLFGSSFNTPVLNRGGGGKAHHVHPNPIVHDEPHAIPMATSTAVHWTSNMPAGLPPFPSGWRPAGTPPSVVNRAWALMGTLPVGETQYEKGGDGGWLAFHASTENGKKFVTAWAPKGAVLAPQVPVGIPVVSPVVVQHPAAATHSTIQSGSKGPDVKLWQERIGISPADGDFGPHTDAVTRSWQSHRGLKGDGIVGPLTWAASETAPGTFA